MIYSYLGFNYICINFIFSTQDSKILEAKGVFQIGKTTKRMKDNLQQLISQYHDPTVYTR